MENWCQKEFEAFERCWRRHSSERWLMQSNVAGRTLPKQNEGKVGSRDQSLRWPPHPTQLLRLQIFDPAPAGAAVQRLLLPTVSASFIQLKSSSKLILLIERFDRQKRIAYCPIYKAASTSLLDWLLRLVDVDAKSVMKYTGNVLGHCSINQFIAIHQLNAFLLFLFSMI